MAKLFVSYSRKDSAAAHKLIQAFKDMGQDVWVDWEDIPPAVGWLQQIFQGIEGSDAFLFLVSPDSVTSEVCDEEVGHAAKNNKRIIPILVRDVDTKAIKVNPTIGDLNWIRLRETDDFKTGLDTVKLAIELDFHWVEEHSRLQLRALEWQRENEPSLLLRGNDLRQTRQLVKEHASVTPNLTKLQEAYIDQSDRAERRRFLLWGATTIAILALSYLTYFAILQRNLAVKSEALAKQSEVLAVQNAALAKVAQNRAELSEADAKQRRDEARKAQITAEAQRSAAKAQIYQSRTGELYTSTLLAIDSWKSEPSAEAEEILRRNISLLPLPLAQFSHGGRINSMKLNTAGDVILTASADTTACTWRLEDRENLFCVSSPESVNDAIFSVEGDLIVTGDESGLVKIFSAADGSFQFDIKFNKPIRNLDIHRDGILLAITEDDGTISMFNLEKRQKSFGLKATGTVYQSGFSPNGKYFATGSTEGIVTIWNLTTNEIFSENKHRGEEVLALEFSPNSDYLISGGKDGYSVFTYTGTGESRPGKLHEDWVEDIAFSTDNSWYATVSHDKKIRVWDTLTDKERIRMSQDSFVDVVQVSPNGQWIATTGADNTVRVWNASTGAEMFQIPLQSSGVSLAFSNDNAYLITGDKIGSIGIWDISATATPRNTLLFDGIVGPVQFDTSGSLLAASDESLVWLLNPDSFSTLTASPQGGQSVSVKAKIKEFVMSPDANLLAISTESDQIFIHDILLNTTSNALPTSGSIDALAITPDGSQLISITSNTNVQTWELGAGKGFEPVSLLEGKSSVTSLAMSQQYLALGQTNRINILSLADNHQVGEIESSGDHPFLSFSRDGRVLASANESGQIEIWEIENGTFNLLFSISKGSVVSIAFNANGNILAIGTTNSVDLIDTATGDELARIPQPARVTGLAFSRDENTLATASGKFIQFWDISALTQIKKESLVDQACSRVLANFNEAQWTVFFGAKKYTRLCIHLP